MVLKSVEFSLGVRSYGVLSSGLDDSELTMLDETLLIAKHTEKVIKL